MNISCLNFNMIKPVQNNNRQNCSYANLVGLHADTVTFTGINKKEKTLEDLVPKNKGTIYKKETDANGNTVKTSVKVDIVKSQPFEFTFIHDGEVIGKLDLTYIKKDEEGRYNGILDSDYENEGVIGSRIDAEYVENFKQDEYGGIAHLADLIAVAACKELGIKPNVVSLSLEDAAPFHYVRGKRFIPFKEYHSDYYDFYDNKEPNDIVREIVENTPKGKNFDTLMIQHEFLTYMPKEMIEDLETELEKNPIF
ncbi:hypothetical protein IJI31_02930 [bacterium]|nr:hypothetical protein [bacterium]